MPFPGYPLANTKTNQTLNEDDHAPTHNDQANAANFLQADINNLTAEPWVNLPLLNGWVNYNAGWQPAQYRRVGDQVQLRGLIKNPTFSINEVAILPLGYRPIARHQMFLQWTVWNGAFANAHRVDVYTTGQINIHLDASNVGSRLTGIASYVYPPTLIDYMTLNGIYFSMTP
jgi:hypothetical protein